MYEVEQLLATIDDHGIDRLRHKEDKTSLKVYHWVLYRAIDMKLRVVYAKVIRHLKSIQLRNRGGRLLVDTRDYELIRIMLEKKTVKVEMKGIVEMDESQLICRNYRQYSVAFFEEVILREGADERAAGNFRERFSTNQKSSFEVSKMYSKMDYLRELLRVDVSQLTSNQIVELFSICWRYDSFKVALHLYLNHMSPFDVTPAIIDKFLACLQASPKFLEEKLFFILEHFD